MQRSSALLVLAALATLLVIVGEGLPSGPPRPDLVVDSDDLNNTWTFGWRYFTPTDCEVVEACVDAPGLRRLLTFSVTIANISQTELVLGDPSTSPLFEVSPCHGHYHLLDFSDYRLLTLAGDPLGAGHKQDWCLSDIFKYLNEPWVSDTPIGFECDYQGLSPGWGDTYSAAVICQWIDITNVPAGDYLVESIVNSVGTIRERDHSNNTATAPVTILSAAGDPDLVLVPSRTLQTMKMEKRPFLPGDLEVKDGCVGDTGYRQLLTFETQMANVSQHDFFLGDPAVSPFFELVGSHGHYHLQDLLEYRLTDSQGVAATPPYAQELWYPTDWMPHLGDPWVRPQRFYRRDDNHGLQRGWYDFTFLTGFYPVPCQWVDVTDVAPGAYDLKMTINPSGLYPESDVTNNTVTIPTVVYEPFDWVAHRPDGVHMPGSLLEVEPAQSSGSHPIHYDVTACPASGYNLYYSLRPPWEYAYDGAVCNLSPIGTTLASLPNPPRPGEMVWFTIVGREGAREGGHGFDSAGRERPLSGASMCGITETLPRTACSPTQ